MVQAVVSNSEYTRSVFPQDVTRRVEMAQGFMSIDSEGDVRFFARARVQRIELGGKYNFRLDAVADTVDCLQLPGRLQEYSATMVDELLWLTHRATNFVITLAQWDAVTNLEFVDARVCLLALRRRFERLAALAGLAAIAESIECASLSQDVEIVEALEGQLPSASGGRGCAVLSVSNNSAVDRVFACNCIARIELERPFASYKASLSGEAGRTLELRQVDAYPPQTIHLLGAAQLIFADGPVRADYLRQLLCIREDLPVKPVEALRITSVALSVGCLEDGRMSSSIDSQAIVDGLEAGQLIEADITFNQALLVVGCPGIEFEIGLLKRVAAYSHGSGRSTLHFIYRVTEADLYELSVAALVCAEDADACKDARLGEVEFGALVTNGALLMQIDSPSNDVAEGEGLRGGGICISAKEPLDIDLDVLAYDTARRALTEQPAAVRFRPTACIPHVMTP